MSDPAYRDRPIGTARLTDAAQDAVPYLTVTVADIGLAIGRGTIQAKDAAGNNLAGTFLLRTWLADAAYSEPDPQASFGVDIAGGELMRTREAKADLEVVSTTAGKAIVTFTVAATKTVHVMAEIAGRIYTGSAEIAGP